MNTQTLTRYRIWPDLGYFYEPSTGNVYSVRNGKTTQLEWDRRGLLSNDVVRVSVAGRRLSQTRRQILALIQPQIDREQELLTQAKEKTMSRVIENPHRTSAVHASKGFIVGTIRSDGSHSSSASPKYHGTYNEAATEAARLATQNPGVKFMVLTVGGIVSVSAATWE
jgi:hypothetical protein